MISIKKNEKFLGFRDLHLHYKSATCVAFILDKTAEDMTRKGTERERR